MAEDSTIEWTPLKRGGANFTTRRFVHVDVHTVSFKPTKGAIAFYLLFLLIGLGALAGGVATTISDSGFDISFKTIFLTLFGLIFAGVGGLMFRSGTRPVVFDKRRDYFWKGRKDPGEYWNTDEIPDFAHLNDLLGLQLIGEHVKSDKSSYISYELNLVFKDGSRINVADHGKLERLADDAEELAEFLGVPILDPEDWS